MSQPTPQRTRCSSAAPCGASSPSPPNPDSIDAITATRALLRISASVDRDSLHNQLASALILIDSSAADEDKLGVHACNRFASGIITVLLQARMRDPFARLPADIVQIVLEFFHPFSVAQFREVSRRWRDAGNVALSRARAVDLSPPEPFALFYGKPGEHGEGHAIPRTERRALAIRMMASHCRCVETLALVVDDDTHGFTKQEVVMALMAMPSVKALIVESRLRIPEFYPDSRPRICMTPEFRGMRPFCSSLRVLSLGESFIYALETCCQLHCLL
ncbi:MAG TPA: F-box protein [Oculatellaceae cyanobacterium]